MDPFQIYFNLELGPSFRNTLFLDAALPAPSWHEGHSPFAIAAFWSLVDIPIQDHQPGWAVRLSNISAWGLCLSLSTSQRL